MTIVIQQLFDGAALGSTYALMALGLSLIFGIMRLMNLAYGQLVMVGAYCMVILANQPLPVVVAGTIATVVVTSVLMEFVAFRPVRQAPATTMLITSFALAIVMQYLAVIIFTDQPKGAPVPTPLEQPVSLFGIQIPVIDIVTSVVALLLLLCLVGLVQRTKFGIQLRAAADDFGMARLLGVDANRVIVGSFVISGFLAAVVAILLVWHTGAAYPEMGLTPLLVALVASVVGGVGSLPGAVVGGFVLGFITILLQAWLPIGLAPFRDAFVFATVIVILLIRPQGLLGGSARVWQL